MSRFGKLASAAERAAAIKKRQKDEAVKPKKKNSKKAK